MSKQVIVVDNMWEFYSAINEYDLDICSIVLNNEQSIKNISSAFDKENINYNITKFSKEKVQFEEIDDISISSNRIVLTSKKYLENMILALYQARLSNASLKILDSYEDVVECISNTTYEFYTLLFDKSEMNLDVIYDIAKLQKNRNNNDGTAFYYGFLVARNHYVLNAQIVKNHAFKQIKNERYVLVDRVDYLSKEYNNNDYITLISYHCADVENIQKEFCTNRNNAVTIIGHGRDDVIWLKDGCICGKSREAECKSVNIEGNKESMNFPACNYHDYCLMKQGKIFNVYNINSRHFFVNACESAKLEECVFSEDYNTAYSFLEGHGISYIGCNQTIMGESVSNFYYVAQLKAGIPLGKIVYNLSLMYAQKGGSPLETYFLLGDPTFGEETELLKYSISDITFPEDKKFEFLISNNTSMVSIEFKRKSIIEDFYNLKVKIWAYIKDKKVFASFRKNGNRIFLDVFSKDILNEGDLLTIVVSDRGSFNVFDLLNTSKLLELNMFDKNLKLSLSEMKSVAASFINTYIFKMNTLDSVYKEVYRKQDKLYLRLSKLNKEIIYYMVNSTHDKGFCFEEVLRFNGMKFVESKYTDDTCVSCGRKACVSVMEHNYYKNIRRRQYHCPICAFIKDIPDGNVNISFQHNSHYHVDEMISERITIINNSNDVQAGYVGIAIVSGKDILVEYDKNCLPIEVGSGESVTVECTYKFNENTRPHQYWLKGYASLNGEVYVTKKDVWIYE